jgi:hypothetical protein
MSIRALAAARLEDDCCRLCYSSLEALTLTLFREILVQAVIRTIREVLLGLIR